MDSITLIVKRRTSFVGMAMPVRVLVNGMMVGQVKVGGTLQVTIPARNCTLELDMVGNSMSIHPIKGQFPLIVSNCRKGVVTVDFGVKPNPFGVLTSGIWQKLGDMKADIQYI